MSFKFWIAYKPPNRVLPDYEPQNDHFLLGILAHLFFPTFHVCAPAHALKTQLVSDHPGKTFSKADDLQVV
jgi:hypothetical protein